MVLRNERRQGPRTITKPRVLPEVASSVLIALHSSSAGTQSVNGSFTLDVLGSAPTQTQWVYGRVPGSQTSTVPGSYTDTIGVTLTYF